MNPRVYKIIVYAIGALAGAALGYVVGELIIYQIEKELVKDEPEENKDENEVVEIPPVESTTYIPGSSDAILPKDLSRSTKRKKKRRNYQQLSEKGNLAQLAEQYETPVDTNKPYIISMDKYAADSEFPKVEITYYNDDDVLTDDDDKVVDNIEDLIGDALNHFGGQPDPDIIYVCNEKLRKNFEVTRVYNSYAKLFLGIEPIAKKKGAQKVKNKNVNSQDE